MTLFSNRWQKVLLLLIFACAALAYLGETYVTRLYENISAHLKSASLDVLDKPKTQNFSKASQFSIDFAEPQLANISENRFQKLLEGCPRIWRQMEGVEPLKSQTSDKRVDDLELIRFCLLHRGGEFLRKGQASEAKKYFLVLLRFLPKNKNKTDQAWVALADLGLAHAFYFLEEYPPAKAYAEQAVQLNPDLIKGYTLLARIAYAQEDLSTTFSLLERAADRTENDEEWFSIDAFRAQVAQEMEVESAYEQRESLHFIVKFKNDVPAPLIEKILQELEGVYVDLQRNLALAPSRDISVILYDTTQFQRIAHGPLWSSAVYDGKIRIPMRRNDTEMISLDSLRKTIRHETTHAFLHQGLKLAPPVWLEEGLAQWISNEAATQDWEQLSKICDEGLSLDFLSADPHSFVELKPEQARLAYAFSAAFVDFLLDQDGWFGIRSLLEVHSQEKIDSIEAIERVYHWDAITLQNGFIRHISRRATRS